MYILHSKTISFLDGMHSCPVEHGYDSAVGIKVAAVLASFNESGQNVVHATIGIMFS
jgi:hypothetical protein